MKKLNKITAAFASLALAAAAFIGCVDSYPDNEPVGELGDIYLRGSMNDWEATDDSKLVAGDTTGFYSVTWQAKGESETFKFADSAWGTQYCQYKGNASYVSNVSGVEITSADDGNGGENDKLTGLSTGSWYKFSVVAGPVSISVTVEEAESQGGVTSSEPVPYYFDGMYLVGGVFKTEGNDNAFNFTAENLIYGASVDSKTGVVTYTKDITAIGENGELGINDSTWNNKIAVKGTEVKADGIAVVITGDGEKGNFNVSGLKVDSPYRVTITTTPEKEVSVSIEEIANYTLTFEIKGLEEGMLAWLNGNCWGSSWPCGWALSGWGGVGEGFALTDAAEADSDGVASFSEKWNVTNVAKPGETLSFELKFIASDDDWESTKFDKDNISFDIEDVSAGTYKVSINAEENTVTVTKQ